MFLELKTDNLLERTEIVKEQLVGIQCHGNEDSGRMEDLGLQDGQWKTHPEIQEALREQMGDQNTDLLVWYWWRVDWPDRGGNVMN